MFTSYFGALSIWKKERNLIFLIRVKPKNIFLLLSDVDENEENANQREERKRKLLHFFIIDIGPHKFTLFIPPRVFLSFDEFSFQGTFLSLFVYMNMKFGVCVKILCIHLRKR